MTDVLAAIQRARQAWERSQPQTFLDLWPDSALDETAQFPKASPGSGGLVERTTLTSGEATEPRYGPLGTDGESPGRGRTRGNAGASVAPQ